MIIDSRTEDCRQCTLKHLSTALVSLTDDIPDILKRIYFCGHLSHAANHFVHINEELAERIRVLRLDAQDEQLNFVQSFDTIRETLTKLIEDIAKYKVPEPAVEAPKAAAATTAAPRKRGCPCQNRH